MAGKDGKAGPSRERPAPVFETESFPNLRNYMKYILFLMSGYILATHSP